MVSPGLCEHHRQSPDGQLAGENFQGSVNLGQHFDHLKTGLTLVKLTGDQYIQPYGQFIDCQAKKNAPNGLSNAFIHSLIKHFAVTSRGSEVILMEFKSINEWFSHSLTVWLWASFIALPEPISLVVVRIQQNNPGTESIEQYSTW